MMKSFPGKSAYEQIVSNTRARIVRVPPKSDPHHFRSGGVFPPLQPKFKIQPGETIFTIGSCFARNIESVLKDYGFVVPVAEYSLLPGELPHADPHMLNEYNAGTIMQRIEGACDLFHYDETMGIEETADGFIDLFLHIHAKPTSKARLLERRAEIDALYKKILEANVVIITLGLVESWFDKLNNCYLNRAPSKKFVLKNPDRFEFHQMDLEDVHGRMSNAMNMLNKIGKKHVIITVSPVPIEATFMPMGAVVANGYSKAVLRACAGLITSTNDQVDYFPSYEIVTSFGCNAFREDNVHVNENVVAAVTHYMVQNYASSAVLKTDESMYLDFISVLQTGDGKTARDIAMRLVEAYPQSWRSYDALRQYFMMIGAYDAALDSAIQLLQLVGSGNVFVNEKISDIKRMIELNDSGLATARAAV